MAAQIGTVEELHTAKGLTKKLLKAAALMTAKVMAKEAAAAAAALAASTGNREERRAAAAAAGKGKEGKKPMVNGGGSASGARASSVATHGNGSTNGTMSGHNSASSGSSGASSSGVGVGSTIKPGLGYKKGGGETSEVVGGKRNASEMQGQGLEGSDDSTAREATIEVESKRPRITSSSNDGEMQLEEAAQEQSSGSDGANDGGISSDGMIMDAVETTQPAKKIKGE